LRGSKVKVLFEHLLVKMCVEKNRLKSNTSKLFSICADPL
jgi:hypothetical protein